MRVNELEQKNAQNYYFVRFHVRHFHVKSPHTTPHHTNRPNVFFQLQNLEFNEPRRLQRIEGRKRGKAIWPEISAPTIDGSISIFTMRCYAERAYATVSCLCARLSVCPPGSNDEVGLAYHEHTGWNNLKTVSFSRLISPRS